MRRADNSKRPSAAPNRKDTGAARNNMRTRLPISAKASRSFPGRNSMRQSLTFTLRTNARKCDRRRGEDRAAADRKLLHFDFEYRRPPTRFHLRGGDSRFKWQSGLAWTAVAKGSDHSVNLTLARRMFPAGRYLIKLSGLRNGKQEPVADYPVQISYQ